MSKDSLKELRSLEDQELLHRAKERRKEIFDLRFKAVAEENPSPARIKTIRKDIARIETLLRERHLKIRGQESK